MLQGEELKDDEGPCNTLEHFTEYEEVIKMIDSLKACDAAGFEKDYEQYMAILNRLV